MSIYRGRDPTPIAALIRRSVFGRVAHPRIVTIGVTGWSTEWGQAQMEPEVGFEPTTCALRVRCSTTELPGLGANGSA